MSNEIPQEYLTTLVELLAETNVLWSPFRHSRDNGPAAAAVFERRSLFRESGLNRPTGGPDATRQSWTRHKAQLRKTGLVDLAGRGRGQTIRLSAAGETVARGVTACSLVDSTTSWNVLRLIADLAVVPVMENDLCEKPDSVTSAQLVDLELRLEPYLVCGWVDSHSDGEGRVGYLLTDSGHAALAAGKPDSPPDMPPLNEAMADLYDRHYAETLGERPNWKPDAAALVVVPLSCGNWQPVRRTKAIRNLLAEVWEGEAGND